MIDEIDRKRLIALLPTPSLTPEVTARLASAPPELLANLVLDNEQTWWRRRACAQALRGRVPAGMAIALLDRVRDPKDTAEVRIALMEALTSGAPTPAAPALLDWLRSMEGSEPAYGLEEAMLAARARLGDASAAPSLATLAYDPWSHRRKLGQESLDVLRRAVGEDALLGSLSATSVEALAFSAKRPADRLLGVRWLHHAGGDAIRALADPDIVVAQHACELFSDGSGPSDDRLEALVESGREAARCCFDATPPTGPAGACLWALCVLMRRGHDVRARWQSLGEPKVLLEGVPEDVRRAILREHAPGERMTDPRWLLEAACVECAPAPDQEAQLARASAALAAAGLSPGEPCSAGVWHQQGDGTYHVLALHGGTVLISTLGPFASMEEDCPPARSALTEAGFRFIDAALGRVVFAGLCVYYFGARDPLTVAELLFYWQD